MGGPDTKDAVPPLVLQTAATLAMVFGDGSSCLSGYLTQAGVCASVPRSVPALRRSRSGAFGVSAPALGAALRRSVQRFCAWCLVLCTWDSTRVDARCTHLDARPFDARRVDASTLGARTATLDASAIRRSVHVPRRSTLRRLTLGASTLGASTLEALCAQLDARRFGA
ncbi:UNVERIFIED_CONTAM: hypothetical protein FKN15_030182 [Acipenser sinensis]